MWSCAYGWELTPSSPIAQSEYWNNSGDRHGKPARNGDSRTTLTPAPHGEYTGAFGPCSTAKSAPRDGEWPVSGPGLWGIQSVAWGEGGSGGGVGGSPRGTDILDHGPA